MKKNTISGIIPILLLISMLNLIFAVHEAESLAPPEVEWSQTYGGVNDDNGRAVVQTSDGGYAVTGWTSSFGAGKNDFWLVKTDSDGNMEWSQTYGGTGYDEAQVLVATSDGGYAMTGPTNSYGAGSWDFWLVKTDMNGNMEWSQTYGGTKREHSYAMIQTSDGGYAIAGQTDSFGAGLDDWWLVKTDSAGHHQWNKTYGGVNNDNAKSLVQTGDGGYAIAGNTASFGAGNDMWVIKVDSVGDMEWNMTFGGRGYDTGEWVIQRNSGGYVIAGYTASFGAGGRDYLLIELDSEGTMLWNKTYGGPDHDSAESFVETCDGGYVIAGTKGCCPSTGNADMWLVKVDSSGNMQWNLTYGGPNDELVYSIVPTLDGGYAVAGYTESFGAGGRDFWLVKIAGPPTPPVGGVWVPINKAELLAPWIILASLLSVSVASIVCVKRRKKQQN